MYLFSHASSQSTPEVVNGADNIRLKVDNLNFAGALINLSDGSIDAQKSDGNGVILMVTGDIVLPGQESKLFVQTFFLAEQTTNSKASYYVRNSILRLLRSSPSVIGFGDAEAAESLTAETQTTVTTQEVETQSHPQSYEDDQADDGKVDEAQQGFDESWPENSPSSDDAIEQADDDDDDDDDADDEEVAGEEEEDDDVAAAAAAEPNTSEYDEDAQSPSAAATTDSSEPEVPNTGPRSYADMARRGSGVAPQAPAPASRASAPKRTPPPTDAAKVPALPPGLVINGTPSPEAANGTKRVEYAVYINKIPENTTVEDLDAVFGPFGKVLKAEPINAKGYAFVTVDTEEALQGILGKEKGFFVLRGATLEVEEKNSKGGASRRGPGRTNTRGQAGGAGAGAAGEKGAAGSTRPRREGGRREGDKGDKVEGSPRGPPKEKGAGYVPGPRPSNRPPKGDDAKQEKPAGANKTKK